MARNYFYYFDVMKGIAIILMVMGHVMLFSFDINPSELSKFIYFNMPIFFYISGFLAYKKFDSFKEVGKRIIHRGILLLFPYVIFLNLYSYFASGTINISLTLGGGGRYWFLHTLFLMSIFFILYEYIIRRVKTILFYAILWLIPYAVLMLLKFNILHIGCNFDNVVDGLANYYRYFLIGYLCKKYIQLNSLLFRNQIVIAISFIAYFLNWYFFECHNIFLIFAGTLGAIIVIQNYVLNYIKADSHIGQMLIKIGKCSLGIYVIHYFLIPDISSIASEFVTVGNPFIWQLAFAILVAIPIVAVSMFVYKLIEMNKWLYFIFFGKEHNR